MQGVRDSSTNPESTKVIPEFGMPCASYQTQKTSPKRPGFFQLLFEYPSIREPGLRVQTLPTCPSKYISQTVPTVKTIFDGFSSSELADVRHGHNFRILGLSPHLRTLSETHKIFGSRFTYVPVLKSPTDCEAHVKGNFCSKFKLGRVR